MQAAPIKGFETTYAVCDDGSVYNMRTGRRLKPQNNGMGYQKVALYQKGQAHWFYVHQLVATAFVDGWLEGMEVNHKDEDKANNRKDNLEWLTHRQNVNYGTRNQRIQETKRKKSQLQYCLHLEQ